MRFFIEQSIVPALLSFSPANLKRSPGNVPFDAVLEVWDNRDVWRLGLCDGTASYSNGLYVMNADATHTQVSDTIDPTAAYHTYQIVFDPKLAGTADDLATYYVDGYVVATQNRAQAKNYSYLYVDFADTGGGVASDSRWSLARFELGQHPVPEPSTLCLSGSGGLALGLLSWRRRRRNDRLLLESSALIERRG